MKYLVIKCEELCDQYECDADREPVCLTDDYKKFDKYGYEIYEITSDNTFKLVKDYNTSSNEGMAIYKWYSGDAEEKDDPDEIMEMERNLCREDYTKSKIEQVKAVYGFEDSVDTIYGDLYCSGAHAEDIDGEWVVIAEYAEGFPWNKGY